MDFGDISKRISLRNRLKCDSFESYLKKVAPERHLPLKYAAFGMVYTEYEHVHVAQFFSKQKDIFRFSQIRSKDEAKNEQCLFANYHKSRDNGLHVPLSVKHCDMYDKYLVSLPASQSTVGS